MKTRLLVLSLLIFMGRSCGRGSSRSPQNLDNGWVDEEVAPPSRLTERPPLSPPPPEPPDSTSPPWFLRPRSLPPGRPGADGGLGPPRGRPGPTDLDPLSPGELGAHAQ